MSNIKKWVGDTINFTYLKSLIAGDNNKDLRELMAVMLTGSAIIVLFYSAYTAKTDDAKLYLFITTCSFIAALFGMDKFGGSKSEIETPKDDKTPD